ncbi:MAG: hypothetical protein RML46_09230 [Anaerolineae bacterium]|nr:hypothetical protein [Anaerolineae bacterium]
MPQFHKIERPAVIGGGARTEQSACGGASYSHFIPSCPACQAPAAIFRRWLAQARACAARDLAAAEDARRAGDLDGYHRLRRRGMRHQALQVALETVLEG